MKKNTRNSNWGAWSAFRDPKYEKATKENNKMNQTSKEQRSQGRSLRTRGTNIGDRERSGSAEGILQKEMTGDRTAKKMPSF